MCVYGSLSFTNLRFFYINLQDFLNLYILENSAKFWQHMVFNTFILFCLAALCCLEDRTLKVTVDCSYQTLWICYF